MQSWPYERPTDYKIDDPYSYPTQAESTLAFLEKTASSIDESKSAFKASLSNITKPTPDMLGYGSQSLYGSAVSAPAPAPIAKPKPKPRSRGRKPANKPEPISKIDQSMPSPMTPQSLKQSDKFGMLPRDDMNDMRVRSTATPTPWRIDDINAPSGTPHSQLPAQPSQQHHQLHASHASHQHSASALSGTQSHSVERNITIPHTTEVNTTYNHTTNQTYQYSGYPSYLPGATKSESSMYSAQGTVHHPHTRSESLTTNTSTVSSASSGSHMLSSYSSAPSNAYASQPAVSTFNQTVSLVKIGNFPHITGPNSK